MESVEKCGKSVEWFCNYLKISVLRSTQTVEKCGTTAEPSSAPARVKESRTKAAKSRVYINNPAPACVFAKQKSLKKAVFSRF